MSSKSNTSLLISLLGISILAGAYFLGYSSYTDKRIQVENEITTLQERYNHLLSEQSNKESYQTKAVDLNLKRKELINKFAYEIASEKIIQYVLELENNVGVHCGLISIKEATSNEAVQQNEQAQSTEQDDTNTVDKQASSAKLINSTVNLSISCTYDQFKDLIRYIDSKNERTTIESVSVAYDQQTKLLNGSLTINLYALTDIERDNLAKEEYNINKDTKGVTNIFSAGLSNLSHNKVEDTTENSTEETTTTQ